MSFLVLKLEIDESQSFLIDIYRIFVHNFLIAELELFFKVLYVEFTSIMAFYTIVLNESLWLDDTFVWWQEVESDIPTRESASNEYTSKSLKVLLSSAHYGSLGLSLWIAFYSFSMMLWYLESFCIWFNGNYFRFPIKTSII